MTFIKNLKNNDKLIIGITFIIKVLMDISYMLLYSWGANKAFNQWTDFSILKYFFGFIAIFIVLIYLFSKKNNIGKIYIYIFVVLMFLPVTTIFAFINGSILYYTMIFIMFLIIIAITFNERKIKIKKLKIDPKITTKILYFTFIISTIISFGSVIYYNGIPDLTALNLRNVYEIRENFYLPRYFDYLFRWQFQFIIPFLIAVTFKLKKHFLCILFISLQFLVFLWTGHKVALFLLPVILFFCLFGRIKNLILYFSTGTTLAIIGSIILTFFSRWNLIFSILVRRLFILPAFLKFIFHDFFQTNERLGLLGTAFNRIFNFNNPYQEIPFPNLIGGEYFQSYEMRANTGFLAEGYARMGYFGMIFMAVILGLILNLLVRFTKKNDIGFALAISAMPLLILNDGMLLPSLFVGNITILIGVLLFFDITTLKSKKKQKKQGLNTHE